MQLYNAPWQMLKMVEGQQSPDQRELVHVLQEIEQKNEKSAINLVNALFLSSTSQSLDKVCLNIFVKIGDRRSLSLLYKKYPTPQAISMSLLPSYINVLAHLGEKEEIELLARVASIFGGLYRGELITAIEHIISKIGTADVSYEVVAGLQKLYEVTDARERVRLIGLTQSLRNDLMISILLCGLESEDDDVRIAAIAALGELNSSTARRELIRTFRKEQSEDVLVEYERWIFPVAQVA